MRLRFPGQGDPTLFFVIRNLLALIVDHDELAQLWVWMVHDLVDFGWFPGMIASDQLGELNLVVNRHCSARDTEEALPLGAKVIDDFLDAPVPNSDHPPHTFNHLQEGEIMGQDDQGPRTEFPAELNEGFWEEGEPGDDAHAQHGAKPSLQLEIQSTEEFEGVVVGLDVGIVFIAFLD